MNLAVRLVRRMFCGTTEITLDAFKSQLKTPQR